MGRTFVKRSEINKAIELAKAAIRDHGFYLPPFAFWTPEDWRRAGPECKPIKINDLGWAVSDFSAGEFDRLGMVMFTFRNGNRAFPERGTPYAEKLFVLKPGQRIPLHFHWAKTEDIINRAGGVLGMRVFNAREDTSVDHDSPVMLLCDGIESAFRPGEPFELHPGQSITLRPHVFHTFWARPDAGILVGAEVSTISDAYKDNRFGEPIQRFTEIEEDELPIHLLSYEYPDV